MGSSIRQPEEEMGTVRTAIEHPDPVISVVIPSRDGKRGGNVDRLLDDLRSQTRQDFEVILAIGFSPNGHARNQGVKAARGKYLVCIDDDVTLGHERVLENLIRPFEIADFRLRIDNAEAQKGRIVREGKRRNAKARRGEGAERQGSEPRSHGEGQVGTGEGERRTSSIERRMRRGEVAKEGQGRNPDVEKAGRAGTQRREGAEAQGRAEGEHRTSNTEHPISNTEHRTSASPLTDDRSALTDLPIGMTGPSQLIPPSQPRWVHYAARQLPRSFFPVANEITDSDMVSHMCLCMSTQLYKDVGWENDEIVRGTDTDLRFRVRKAGYRIVVVPDAWAYHPLPDTPRKLLKMWFDKGKWTAYNRRRFPGFHFEAPDGVAKDFVPLRSMRYRVARYAFRVLAAMATMKPVRLATQVAYVCGYAKGLLTEEEYGG